MRIMVRKMTVVLGAALFMAGSAVICQADTITGPSPTGTSTGPSSTSTSTSKKNGWVSVQNGRETVWNYYQNGEKVTSKWIQNSAGLWFYLQYDGSMAVGWGEDEVNGYYFESNGAMATGWREISDNSTRVDGPSSSTQEKGWYYFDASGKQVFGWKKINNSWYYLNDNDVDEFGEGQMLVGEVTIGHDDYYFGKDGVMKTGLVKVSDSSNQLTPGSSSSDNYFLYGDNGVKVVGGWGKANGKWYYLDDDGYVMKGFIGLDRNDSYMDDWEDAYTVFYMGEDGTMVTGWLDLGESEPLSPSSRQTKQWYYFSNKGVMTTGWLKVDGKWFYFAPDNNSYTDFTTGQALMGGLYEIDDEYFYFTDDCYMATSTWKKISPDNSTEEYSIYLGSDGVMYRADASNDLLVSSIGSRTYVFNEDGYMLRNTTIHQVNGKWVQGEGSKGETIYTISSNGYATKSKVK